MRLLLCSHVFPPSIGGVETSVLSLADGLSRRRTARGDTEFDVTVATNTPAGSFDDASLSFRVSRKPTWLHLWKLIRRSDIIHLAGPSLAPMLLACFARKPFIIEHHGYQAICPNGLLLHLPERAICPGHFMAGRYSKCIRCQRRELSALKTLKSLLLMFPRRLLSVLATGNIAITSHVGARVALPRISTIYYGVDTTPKEEFAAPSYTPARISFAFLGRFVQEKGISILLQAAQQLAGEGFRFDVQLIGDGPERPCIEAMIRSSGLDDRVYLPGALTGRALADALRRSQVIVVPSVWEEAAGLAAIEPMMRGKAVIASEIGGLAEVVADSGFVFPVGNAKALADLMRQILLDPAQCEKLGARSRERASSLFDLRRMIDGHAELYHHSVCCRPHDSAQSMGPG